MKKVIDSISFWIGFTFGVILFLVINVSDVVKQSSRICFDCDKGYGKPFRIYESGSMIHNREILWGGVIADVLIALIVSTIIGWVFYFIVAELFKPSSLK
ncbi:MAG: hypothetical protein IPN69_14460 [Acidobacteria bacterium]|nr:hypothetical protein [Acidobacteriota bacterium]